MAKLLYQGHGSYRVVSKDGLVIYVDPYAGVGYDLSADIVLVTHEHADHNDLSLINKKKDCRILRAADMLVHGKYRKLEINGVMIEAVPAYNENHKRDCCVGYIITIDGIKIYASGDTSYTDFMQAKLSQAEIDYALLPIDGIFNMDVKEAEKCAKIINPRHTIPIHTSPVNKPSRLDKSGVSVPFDLKKAESLDVEGRIIMRPADEIELFGK